MLTLPRGASGEKDYPLDSLPKTVSHEYPPCGDGDGISPLYLAILQDGKQAEIDSVINENDADIDPYFLGFTDVYKHISAIVPTDRMVLDFGCAYAPQAWYFRNHDKYVGIDPTLARHRYFKTENGMYFPMSAGEFLKNHKSVYESEITFAICSFAPPWYGEDPRAIVRREFEDCFCFYPKHREEFWPKIMKPATQDTIRG